MSESLSRDELIAFCERGAETYRNVWPESSEMFRAIAQALQEDWQIAALLKDRTRAAIRDRRQAGESVADLAKDFGVPEAFVEALCAWQLGQEFESRSPDGDGQWDVRSAPPPALQAPQGATQGAAGSEPADSLQSDAALVPRLRELVKKWHEKTGHYSAWDDAADELVEVVLPARVREGA